jgi:hypothetical protein
MASGALNMQDSIPNNQIEIKKQEDAEKVPKPTDGIEMNPPNDLNYPITAPQAAPEAPLPVSLPGIISNSSGVLAAAAADTNPLLDASAVIPAFTNPPYHQNYPSYAPQADPNEPPMVSPFEVAAPPGCVPLTNFAQPPAQIVGQLSQPRNSSLDSAGSASRRHHLLRHTLPSESIGEHAVHHFYVTNVPDALRAVQKMSQRDLQQAFERVYNVKSSSNNNNWLRKKLVEGKKSF